MLFSERFKVMEDHLVLVIFIKRLELTAVKVDQTNVKNLPEVFYLYNAANNQIEIWK